MKRHRLAFLTFAALAALACQPGTNDTGPGTLASTNGSEVAAEIDGQPVTVAELDAWIKEDLFRGQAADPSELFELRDSALQQMFEERALEAEAQRRGVDIATLIDQEVAAQGALTDTELRAWYDENRARLNNAEFEDIQDQIRSFLERQRFGTAREAILESSQFTVYLEPPRVEVAAVGPSKGPADAPVTIVEFSDFECPFCSRVLPTLDQVMARYPNQVRIVYRNFPLRNHPRAGPAAEAALCAGEQEKFWVFHDMLFANSRKLSDDDLNGYAEELELDMPAFEACYTERRFAEQVARDFREGQAAGVTGTPAFLVIGVSLWGARPASDFYRTIDAELARLKEGA